MLQQRTQKARKTRQRTSEKETKSSKERRAANETRQLTLATRQALATVTITVARVVVIPTHVRLVSGRPFVPHDVPLLRPIMPFVELVTEPALW